MKHHSKRMWRSAVSIMLVLSLVLGSVTTVFATEGNTEQNTINYVSLGASNTNGYGLYGYLPSEVSEDPLAASKADMNVYGYKMAPEEAYPAQVAAALGDTNGSDQLAISSMRVEEVRYLLDDTMNEDAYMNWRFTGGQKWFAVAARQDGMDDKEAINALRQDYQKAITDADYITVDLGWNNFGVYAFNNIKTILASGNYWKEPDENKFAEYKVYEKVREIALEKLSEKMSGTDASLKDKLGLIADVLAYTTMGACYDYDTVMEKIYELNPDATVAVINIQNLGDDLAVEFEGHALALGDIYGELIDFVNLYRASESPYADKCVYVDAGDVTTFLDELVDWKGDPTTLSGDMKDCFDMYDDNLYVRSIVEYMMVGQALSGLFQGFRDMGANYGLDVFKNDSYYTYEFALTRTPEQLLSLDLGALDLNNPAGTDADVEAYGKALAPHLKNLRGEGKLDAYNYVFEDLITALKNQKAGVESQLNDLKNMKDQLEPVKGSEPYTSQYNQVVDGISQCETGIAQLTQAIDVIVPQAKAEFANKLQGIYDTYHNTLDHAYDVVATIFQHAAKKNALEINASSLNGFNDVSGKLMEGIFGSFVNSAQTKFYYELQKNGVQNTGVLEAPDVIDENIKGIMNSIDNDTAVAAIAVLAVRYELGNSFFAHPNPAGHDEITDAVMNALANGSNADDFIKNKTDFYAGFKDLIKEEAHEIVEDVITGAIDFIKENGTDALTAAYTYLEDNGYLDIMSEVIPGFEDEALPIIEALVEEGTAAVKAMEANYEASTSFEYELQKDNYYVALGDSTAYGFDGDVTPYGDRLAKELGLANSKYNNLSEEDMTAEKLLETIEANKEDIAKADLVTVGLGNGEIIQFVLDQMLADEPEELAWSKIAGESGAAEVEKALAKIEEKLLESMDEEIADMLMVALESYAYRYAELASTYPEVVEAIHEISPEAQIVIVGMYNPLEEVVFAIEGMEKIAIGEYLDYIVKISNAYTLGVALLNENTVYVDAPAVENNVAEGEMELRQILNLLMNPTALYPTDAGHEYIKEQIMDITTLTEGLLWGDANRDGKVSPIDASFVLQYYTKQMTEEDLDVRASDVNGDGKVTPIDASFILQHYTKQIDKFSVEQ